MARVSGLPDRLAEASDHLLRPLVRILLALEPYLGQLTLIGGWIPFLYARFGGFAEWNAPSTLTIEADILAP